MVTLSVISQGLQIYIQAIFSWGILLGESLHFFARIFSNKNNLEIIRLYTKRETDVTT